MVPENKPKRNGATLIWIIAILSVLVIIFLITRNKNSDKNITAAAASDSTTIESEINANWSGVDPQAPTSEYEELKDSDVTIRANDQFALYSIGESVLFNSDSKVLRPEAEKKLKEIVASIEKRFSGGAVRVYGYTDAVGSKESNKQLAEDRAEAVRAWLMANSKFPKDQITINPVGESKPVATNGTEAGRKQNRRVEIAVRKVAK
jgi:outer membrane protein OmpA-like peptidoglycan-associated protein